jgi:predicted HicB family RNase H-like nuclease
MNENDTHRTTTFQISHNLHNQMRLMCALADKSMGEFIRNAISEKIQRTKLEKKDVS